MRATAATRASVHSASAIAAEPEGAPRGWRRLLTHEGRAKVAPWIAIGFLLLVAALIAYRVRQIHWPDVVTALRAYPARTLAAAAALAVASHFTYACYDLLGRRYVRHTVAAPAVLATAFISYAFNLNFGTLIGGVGFRLRLYGRLGLDAAKVGRVIVFALVTNWSGWLLLAGAGFAARQVRVPASFPLSESVLQVFGFAMLVVPLVYLGVCFFSRRRSWHWRSHEFTLPTGTLALAQVALSSLNWALISAIVWVLVSKSSYGEVMTTLLSAAIIGVVTRVPGGLGVVEAVFVSTLGASVGEAPMIAALLVYRAFYYLVPLAAAVLLHFGIEAATRRRRPRAAT